MESARPSAKSRGKRVLVSPSDDVPAPQATPTLTIDNTRHIKWRTDKHLFPSVSSVAKPAMALKMQLRLRAYSRRSSTLSWTLLLTTSLSTGREDCSMHRMRSSN
ncbi:DNA replication licensing factor mcm5 [Alternaria alternata]|nr:DNA replication licensing factor mcm5 [Alternaria alternata]